MYVGIPTWGEEELVPAHGHQPYVGVVQVVPLKKLWFSHLVNESRHTPPWHFRSQTKQTNNRFS